MQDRVDYTYGNPVVSSELSVPVNVLEEQRTRTNLGYGGLMIANTLSRETRRSFDEIVAMKQSGVGWGRIAQENGVKLGPIISRLDRADSAFKKVKIDKKADKFVNGHDARDGKLDGSGPGDGHDRSVVKAAKGKRGKGKSKDTDKAHDGDNDKSSVFNPSRDSSRGFEALARQPLPLVQRNEQPTIHLFGCDVSAH